MYKANKRSHIRFSIQINKLRSVCMLDVTWVGLYYVVLFVWHLRSKDSWSL